MLEVGFSSLFLCRITRCQSGSAPRPTQADRQAILCTWTRAGSSTITAPGKSGNWQVRATGREVNIWPSWRWKGSRERKGDVCPPRELEGDWTRRRCVLSLRCSPNYPAAVPQSRQWKARTSENYRTPLARDNPSIRGGGQVGVWVSLQTMPDGGGGRNLKQPDMPHFTLLSLVEPSWRVILNNIQTDLAKTELMEIGSSVGWKTFLKTVWSYRRSGILSLSTMKLDPHICKTKLSWNTNLMCNSRHCFSRSQIQWGVRMGQEGQTTLGHFGGFSGRAGQGRERKRPCDMEGAHANGKLNFGI